MSNIMTFEQELEKTKNPAMKRIGNYLKERALIDPSIANALKKENKSLNECWAYVFNQIRATMYKSGNFGCAAGDDQELFDMAVHYYDEDNIIVDKIPEHMKMVDMNQQNVSVETENSQITLLKTKIKEQQKQIEVMKKQELEQKEIIDQQEKAIEKQQKVKERKSKKIKESEQLTGQISIFDEF